MTINLTLDNIMIPALPFFTPTFGTKKAEGGLTTEEVNNNILAFFSKRRPIIIIENSDTTRVEYDANLLLNTAGLTLTLGAGAYVGCTVTVTFPAGGNLQYTSKIGVVTDTLRATASVSYIWKGTWWEAIIGKCAVDDVLFQMPDVPNPGLMYGGQWEEHPYGGMFFRAQGGNAKAFTPAIAGSFTSELVFTASAALPSGVAVGDLIIAGNEYRTITEISGQNITINQAFTNRSNITNVLVGQANQLLAHVHYLIKYCLCAAEGTTGNYLPSADTWSANNSNMNIECPRTQSTGKEENRPHNITIKCWKRIA